jgi:hypothetical protein
LPACDWLTLEEKELTGRRFRGPQKTKTFLSGSRNRRPKKDSHDGPRRRPELEDCRALERAGKPGVSYEGASPLGSGRCKNRALKAREIEIDKCSARFVRYWGEGYGIDSPANIRDEWAQIFGWLDQHLKGTSPEQRHR